MEAFGGHEPRVGEIRAVRTFRIDADGVLYPLFSADAWHDGANTAGCRVTPSTSNGFAGLVPLTGADDGAAPETLEALDGVADPAADEHVAPVAQCRCGFYAYGSVEAALEYPHARHVLAVVACWGRVIAGSRGLRAQYARIEALWASPAVPRDLLDRVAARYPSVTVHDDLEHMLQVHPVTALDCYDPPPVVPSRRRRIARMVGVGAVVLASAPPATALAPVPHVRVLLAAAVVVFAAAGVLGGRGRADRRVLGRRGLTDLAIALWIAAALTGPLGLVTLRLPLVQMGLITGAYRWALSREARRFPTRVA